MSLVKGGSVVRAWRSWLKLTQLAVELGSSLAGGANGVKHSERPAPSPLSLAIPSSPLMRQRTAVQ